jgi:purine-cytosine permease-like protein
MWFGANTTIATFALGTLGSSVFGLDFRPATLTIIFFNLISTIPVAYFSTFGPKLGLRQMTLSRFSFALYFPNWIPVILNLVACLGWSTVKCIAGALTLSAAKFPKIPSTAGVIIIAISSLVPSFVGYRYVFSFERYSWIPNAVMFFLIFGLCGQYFDFSSSGNVPTSVTVASVLSFGSAVCGFGLGWSSLAADYTVNYPEE